MNRRGFLKRLGVGLGALLLPSSLFAPAPTEDATGGLNLSSTPPAIRLRGWGAILNDDLEQLRRPSLIVAMRVINSQSEEMYRMDVHNGVASYSDDHGKTWQPDRMDVHNGVVNYSGSCSKTWRLGGEVVSLDGALAENISHGGVAIYEDSNGNCEAVEL